MKIIDYLKENRTQLNNGLPINLIDVVDEREVYAGNFKDLVEWLDKTVGLEHVKNARFIFDDIDNGEDRIVLWYMKDIKEYDDFDLSQFAGRLKRLQLYEASLENETEQKAPEREENFFKSFGVPCDFGDTVYGVFRGKVSDWHVDGFQLLDNPRRTIIHASRVEEDGWRDHFDFWYERHIGFELFMNKEDAVKAIKESEVPLDSKLAEAEVRSGQIINSGVGKDVLEKE